MPVPNQHSMLKQRTQTNERADNAQVQVKDPERFVYMDNRLLKFGVRHLSAPAIKILYLVITKYLNSDISASHPVEVDIPVTEIRNIAPSVTDREQANRILEEFKKPFKIPDGIFIKGENYQGELTWFTSITKVGEKKDMTRFRFDPIIFEPILIPRSSTTLYRPEINRLRSAYAIKIFQVLRSIQNRKKDWTLETRRKFGIDQIKDILGIPRFKKLDLQVVQKALDEINQFTNMRVKKVINHPREDDTKVIEFAFAVKPFKKPFNGSGPNDGSSGGNSGESPGYDESDKKIKLEQTTKPLTWTQQIAFDKLVAFGVRKDIALQQIIPCFSTGEILGFEDIFLEQLLACFKENSPINNAEIFTDWWLNGIFFQPSEKNWQSCFEKLKLYKAQLKIDQPEIFAKRIGKDNTISFPEAPTIQPTQQDVSFLTNQ